MDGARRGDRPSGPAGEGWVIRSAAAPALGDVRGAVAEGAPLEPLRNHDRRDGGEGAQDHGPADHDDPPAIEAMVAIWRPQDTAQAVAPS